MTAYKLSNDQKRALKALYERGADGSPNYLHFRRRVQASFLCDCLMIQWHGMWLGIERDGYTHS